MKEKKMENLAYIFTQIVQYTVLILALYFFVVEAFGYELKNPKAKK